MHSLNTDLEELVAETWIATRSLTSPSAVRWKAKRRLIDLVRQKQTRFRTLRDYSRLLRVTQENEPGEPEPSLIIDRLVKHANLNEAERDLLYRRYYREMNVQEIARSLGRRTSDVGLDLRKIEFKLREIAIQFKETQSDN